ncbi:MAG TPA: calcium-binding protein [Planctomycetota bacterium]|nr:calcium-binding protein [Planctomycetota bacterium]
MVGSRSKLLAFCFGTVLCAPLPAQVTERVDVAWNGAQSPGGGDLIPGASVSGDGRYVLFTASSVLVPGDTNGTWDVFVRDRVTSTTERVSVATGGGQANGYSSLYGFWITPNGRYVAFESSASNLVPGDTNGFSDVFLRDRVARTTERVSVATGGSEGNAQSWFPSVSADGRYVAFTSLASTLVAGDTNGTFDVFLRDRLLGTTALVSAGMGGANGDSDSYVPVISADGQFVAFESTASNLVPGDTNGTWDVFVWERLTGTMERVSVSTGGAQGNGVSSAAVISTDGRLVGFTSTAANLIPGDTNGAADAFVRDRQLGTTERVSLNSAGGQINSDSGCGPLSTDGRLVVFGTGEVFIRDRVRGVTELVTVSTGGAHANGASAYASMSSDGRYVAFRSSASNLVAGDTNGRDDVFLHDRNATGFRSQCWPGVSGVVACPCSNPPSGPNRGCDNSSATGGASLSASGNAYLSIDSVVFTTSGERPTALSVLMQGSASLASGLLYGQGVRCAGGSTKRLFVKTAVGGSITAPNFVVGDSTVSARSAAKGDVIQPGQSRWYLVYYRDPIVLGGCSASSTFNATQTGQVTWWP